MCVLGGGGDVLVRGREEMFLWLSVLYDMCTIKSELSLHKQQ